MTQPGWFRSARTFQPFIIGMVAFLILTAPSAFSSPCKALKARPEAWVGGQVNAFVLAAHAWYERDSAERVYDRVIDRIEGTVTKCALRDDVRFRARYPEFLDFVDTLALARRPDHELGFTVPDETYFAETRQY